MDGRLAISRAEGKELIYATPDGVVHIRFELTEITIGRGIRIKPVWKCKGSLNQNTVQVTNQPITCIECFSVIGG